ncbi:MAG: hypothetical protein GTO63_18355 [Anaerolineae bacterium]|nr:hypothetical protein [Anaerolineae bacterium]NIN96733.1 hypothetical protein [Anaerolineae bacterium]
MKGYWVRPQPWASLSPGVKRRDVRRIVRVDGEMLEVGWLGGGHSRERNGAVEVLGPSLNLIPPKAALPSQGSPIPWEVRLAGAE